MRQRLLSLGATTPIPLKAATNRYFMHNRFIILHLYRITPSWSDLGGHNTFAINELHRTLAHGPCMVLVWSFYGGPMRCWGLAGGTRARGAVCRLASENGCGIIGARELLAASSQIGRAHV